MNKLIACLFAIIGISAQAFADMAHEHDMSPAVVTMPPPVAQQQPDVIQPHPDTKANEQASTPQNQASQVGKGSGDDADTANDPDPEAGDD